MPLPAHLEKLRVRIEAHAYDYGLDFFDVVFECVSFDQMNMIAAYGGFPTRYPHWKFGMEYEQLSKGYTYGLSKIYELVINNDPTYAYLMDANAEVDQKLVMAHVFGHGDFFKNNFAFAHTNRKMMDTMANHGTKIRRYIDRFGLEQVEAFIDRCLSIENLIDPQSPYIRRRAEGQEIPEDPEMAYDSAIGEVHKLKADREYMQGYINPSPYIQKQREEMAAEKGKPRKIPERPERDILLFLLEHAPLENWQRDVLGMLRDEAYYFAPQGQTKIMNEGWASFWHTRIMTEKVLEDHEVIDYADLHAGTMGTQPGGINPYKLGLELFRDIEERWNAGRFGKDFEECTDLAQRAAWNTGAQQGREKVFEVRRHYNDVTFIDEYLTDDFARRHKMFNYAFNKKTQDWQIATREFRAIKSKLLGQLTNMGHPAISVLDANHANRGELLLKHMHEGVDLQQDFMRDTLNNVYQIWSRPVVLVTRIDTRMVLVTFDGQDFSETDVESEP